MLLEAVPAGGAPGTDGMPRSVCIHVWRLRMTDKNLPPDGGGGAGASGFAGPADNDAVEAKGQCGLKLHGGGGCAPDEAAEARSALAASACGPAHHDGGELGTRVDRQGAQCVPTCVCVPLHGAFRADAFATLAGEQVVLIPVIVGTRRRMTRLVMDLRILEVGDVGSYAGRMITSIHIWVVCV